MAAATLAAMPAKASVLFSGTGVFGPHISTMAPVEIDNATFAFSFGLPDIINANPTTQVTNSHYTVNGVDVVEPITSVLFYPASLGGGFDLYFAHAPAVVSLYLADVGSTFTLIPGRYAFTLDGATGEAGSGTVTLTAVPEPATWALMIGGFGLAGAALRRRRAPARA